MGLVRLGTRPRVPGPAGTQILVGDQARAELSRELSRIFGERPCVLLVDARVRALHGGLIDELDPAPLEVLELPPGEACKTPETWTACLRALARADFERRGYLIAFGGGATGDLGAFVAASWHRGIDCVQVPTTLLAMVDAGLGGKCAIDLPEGRNLVGAFHDARLLVADPCFLRTLEPSDFAAGLGEVAKYAIGFSAELFRRLESGARPAADSETSQLEDLIAHCLELKTRIVDEDPLEQSGRRTLLNLGHSSAHALEAWALQQGEELPHGLAVGLGLRVALTAARDQGRLNAEDLERATWMLDHLGLPARLAELCPGLALPDAGQIESLLRRDKKREGEDLVVVLPTGLGSCKTERWVTADWAERTLAVLG